ncbi:hypothetical protein V8C35DRAFT_316974 [Trichoderma chlorosporum]
MTLSGDRTLAEGQKEETEEQGNRVGFILCIRRRANKLTIDRITPYGTGTGYRTGTTKARAA